MITILSTEQGQGHGAEAVLAELLRAWPDDAIPLQVLTPQGAGMTETVEAAGHSVVMFPAERDAFRANWSAAGHLDKELRGTRLIHAWTARGFEAARRMAYRCGIQATGTLHDHPRADFHGPLRRRTMRMASRGFAGLVCVSDAVRVACREADYRCPLTVVRNGLADHEVPARKLQDRPVRIGFLGMYARWKGFGVIEDWVQSTRDLDIEWRLYGDTGPELVTPAAFLAETFGDRVRLMGRRPPQEIFAEIDLLAHASSGFDPLPTVLIEAARAGIPSTACDRGGAGEIVVDGETGFLFPPQNPQLGLKKLRELITDSTLRTRQATAARERFVSSFGVARMVQEYRSFWPKGPSEHHAAK